MKTWKKILIAALCVLAVSVVIFVGMLADVYYEKNYKISYWESSSEYISPNIILVYGYKGMQGFEQLKDIRTGEFTTPQLNHVFINMYNSEDSLVVFRTHDRKRGYLNVNTGKIIIHDNQSRFNLFDKISNNFRFSRSCFPSHSDALLSGCKDGLGFGFLRNSAIKAIDRRMSKTIATRIFLFFIALPLSAKTHFNHDFFSKSLQCMCVSIGTLSKDPL